MTLEEQTKNPITLNASIPAYTPDSLRIAKKDLGHFLTDNHYEKEFYADEHGVVKAVLFHKRKVAATMKEKQPATEDIGKPALDFDHEDIQGNQVTLSSLKGKVVVLNFWFINCKPCVLEMPELNALKSEFGDDVVFLAVTFDEKEKVIRFLKQSSFAFQILPDAMEICRKWKVSAFPTNVVLDQSGRIRLEKIGYDKHIRQILGDAIRQLRKK